ncbi:Na+/H+ antiporter subunit E [Alloalcanivorax profundimaris]|nr:Na+/H+ antiporter subunit E [Alloalcanivorax profundimaris]MAO58622.1 Na+/H+ antiporter subunit E [Alcanivorax sp.]UWN50312.1 Na(+)/H(+) antiporter subunit E [Alcanivorax sp. ALC70]MAY09474.1 Na+/H+ antiporter subunit E [Alcanivorax sp.]MBF1803119.1 Na+/H+ antiporter subunit E [Alloalcanivorax profundimaris]MBU59362.1 Na+/H+ antiporter subunit E [Alcanivorax sp.]|tara:strand:- start:527 stop:1015 length:489 start_codon:yes stop_codon:yes gene_type:complete
MMSRLLPFPMLSLLLWLSWLLLNGFSWGHGLLGLVLAVVLPLGTRPFWPNVPRLRDFPKLVRFVLVVHWDIITANVVVARLILGSPRKLRPAFVELPLELTDDFAITLLASTISLTPGTVSADVSEDRRTLLIHALDMDDEAELVAQIKQRYERPLKEIFEC